METRERKEGSTDLLRLLALLCWRDRTAKRELKFKEGLGKRDTTEKM